MRRAALRGRAQIRRRAEKKESMERARPTAKITVPPSHRNQIIYAMGATVKVDKASDNTP